MIEKLAAGATALVLAAGLSGCIIIDSDGKEQWKWITRYKNARLKNYTYEKLLRENFISQPAVFFRKDINFKRLEPIELVKPEIDLKLTIKSLVLVFFISIYRPV